MSKKVNYILNKNELNLEKNETKKRIIKKNRKYFQNDKHKWEYRFMEIAKNISNWSKDPKRKVGSIIVGNDKEIISTGYNGLPRNVDDEKNERYEKPDKIYYVEHAERNAIYNAARLGIKTMNCDLYTTLYPCSDCARAIIQSGIKRIIINNDINMFKKDNWKYNCKISKKMLNESNVEILIL